MKLSQGELFSIFKSVHFLRVYAQIKIEVNIAKMEKNAVFGKVSFESLYMRAIICIKFS